MKKHITIIVSMLCSYVQACPTCEKAQPKIFRGITHGAGPDSNWDYLIIGATAIIVVYCGLITVKKIVNPNEKNRMHIKNAFLN